MNPKVSVVVPVYNLEFYIDRCLRSLENQTLQDIEVLVVNDGGTDDSQLIIDEYVARRPDIFKSHIKKMAGMERHAITALTARLVSILPLWMAMISWMRILWRSCMRRESPALIC